MPSRKDARAKSRHDPLTGITKVLGKPGGVRSGAGGAPGARAGPGGGMSERERALAMLAKRNGTAFGETPRHSWRDDLEREKDSAGDRYNAQSWDQRPSSGRR